MSWKVRREERDSVFRERKCSGSRTVMERRDQPGSLPKLLMFSRNKHGESHPVDCFRFKLNPDYSASNMYTKGAMNIPKVIN